CSELIIKFKSLGHEVSHLPLLSINKVDYEIINYLDYGGIIFTSANAVKFLELKKINKKILCFCVGSATETKARSAGFQNVITAEGNVENLKELVLQNFDQKNGKLIYVSGKTISVDLDQQLIKEGYNIKRIVNYRTTHNQKFDENFVKELKLKIPDMVYVYSQNSALSFLNFIKIYQSETLWMDTNLMCMGEKTSSILNEIKWKKIFLFNPGEEEFLLYKI
ncbi:uroporphyrinogen-III synthase, partial [Candidatus Pelagibacter sp.]|nr:uroporphyrinogen-III synthase [Candidatus Pelagibacter sp.]